MTLNDIFHIEQTPFTLEKKSKLKIALGTAVLFVILHGLFVVGSFIFNGIFSFVFLFGAIFYMTTLFLFFLAHYNVGRNLLMLTIWLEVFIVNSIFITESNNQAWGSLFLCLSAISGCFVLYSNQERNLRTTFILLFLLLVFGQFYWGNALSMETYFNTGNSVFVQYSLLFFGISVQLFWLFHYFEDTIKLRIKNDESSMELDQLNKQKEKIIEAHKKMVDDVDAAQSEENKRLWIMDGINKSIQIIRNQNTVSATLNSVLQFIIKYTQAEQGGVFLQKENELLLMAQCGFPLDRIKETTLSLDSENYITACFFEKDRIVRHIDVEEHSIVITGLSEIKPNTIFWVPLKTNQKILGVLEVVFIHKPKDHHLHFIEKVSEYLASNIDSIQTKEISERLIQESKYKMEQLSSQEEEMRQNMEEMSATQEELLRKEKDYQIQIEQLKIEIDLKRK